jgi:hypothetical protein
VVNRLAPDISPIDIDVAEIASLGPGLIVITFGASEVDEDGDMKQFKREVSTLIKSMQEPRNPRVLLIGLVPPTMSMDDQTANWNTALADVARESGVEHINLLAGWPTDDEDRSALTDQGARLSDQGHARVAAAVCDVVLPTTPRKKRRQ